ARRDQERAGAHAGRHRARRQLRQGLRSGADRAVRRRTAQLRVPAQRRVRRRQARQGPEGGGTRRGGGAARRALTAPRARAVPRSPAEQTVLSVLRSGERWLRERGVEAQRRRMALLRAHVLGLHGLQLYVQFDRPLSSAELDALRALLVRRGGHEPIAYVLGEAAFHDVVLRTDARALVPRPETEGLVERAIACAGH